MGFLLGVDGGGSKTFALVSDREGRVLGFGRAGGSNHQDVGLPVALKEIERAIRGALDAAGTEPPEIDLAMCGLSGADFPEEHDMLRRGIEGFGISPRVEVVNDALIALRSGASRPWGVVVVCGTAFNAGGRDPDGRTVVLPAQGWISGDWGGGETIAQEMIRLVMRADDGRGTPTLLTELLLGALGQGSPTSLMRALYEGRIGRQDVVPLVPLLFEAASRDDGVARGLVVQAGTELGQSAAAVIRRLGMQELPVEVVLAGGVFKGGGELLVDTVGDVVRETAPEAVLVRPRFEPVFGAVMLGLEDLGEGVDETVDEELRRGQEELALVGRPVR